MIGSVRPVEISIVLPSYRAADLANRSATDLADYLDRRSSSWEIIVVDDGGGDFRRPPGEGDPRIKLLELGKNRGKGAAVRAGMRAARGESRIFTDIDLPYEPELIPVIAEYLRDGFHVVVGDRTLLGSSYDLNVGWRRRLASDLFSIFVGRLVTGGFFDTQCGLKGFRGDVADEIFDLARLDRFAFDVELIYLALLHRLDIKRIPVRLRRNDTSSVRLARDSMQMLLDVLRIKTFQMRGAYRSRVLDDLVLNDFLRRHSRTASDLPGPAITGVTI